MVGLGRWVLRNVLRLAYGVRVTGLEHYAAAGKRVLIVANHTSFLDAALLAAFLPDRLTFAINTEIAKRWWIKPLLKIVDAFPLNPTNPYSLKSLIRYIEQDKRAAIFPEGRITVTGSLMKIYPGPGLVADKSRAMVLPIRIDGAQYTPFSRLRGRMRLRLFPQITLTIMPPRRLEVPASVRGRERRRVAGKLLADLMTEMMFATSNYRRTRVRRAARCAARPRRAPRDRRGRRAGAADLQPAARARSAARRPRRERHAPRRGRRRHAAERDCRRRHVLRFAGVRPRAGNAELHARREELARVLPGGADPPHLHVRALRRGCQARASRRQAARGGDRRLPRGPARAHHAVAQDQGRRREPICGAPLLAPTRRARRARDRAFYFGLGGDAERCRAVARQPAREPRAGRGAHRFQRAGRDPERTAVVSLVRALDGHAAAAAVRHAHVLLSVAAALPHRSRDRVRRERHAHVRHEHVPGGLRTLRAPLRLLQRALRVRRRREAQGRDAPSVDRQVRRAGIRGLRHDGDEPRARREHADRHACRHGRAFVARHRIRARSGSGRRGRAALRARAERHARLPEA